MSNAYRALLNLLPGRPLQVGEVLSASGGVLTVELPGGATIQARGAGTVGSMVFVRDGVVEGSAPSLSLEVITV